MKLIHCPKCKSDEYVKSGVIKGRQRFKCTACGYHFTVFKAGKNIVSHVSVMNWVRQYGIQRPENLEYHPTYKVLNHSELKDLMADRTELKSAGFMVTELGDKFMVIRWERFRKTSVY